MLQMNQIKLIKNRSDIGAGTRGSDMGIDAIEVAAINMGSDYFTRFDYVDVASHNESVYNKVTAVFAKRIGFVVEQCNRVCDAVSESLNEGKFPLVMSGDHSSALGTISGIKKAFPDKRLGVVWIDAHADLHSPYTTPSGNVHGMPLAAAIGEDNTESAVNGVSDHTLGIWNDLKAIGADSRKVFPTDIIFFGVRDYEAPEKAVMDKYGIKNYTVAEYRYRGPETCLNEALAQLDDCDLIYISFDVDSLDSDLVSNGTGTPVSKGFDPDEVKNIITGILSCGKVSCLEFTEVNPLLDTKGNRMAEVAFEILEYVTDHLLVSGE